MPTTSRAVIVIRASDQRAANDFVQQNLGGTGRTFTVPLSTTERGEIEAYWCSWATTDAEYAVLLAEFNLVNRGGGIRKFYDGRIISSDAVLLTESLVRRLPS